MSNIRKSVRYFDLKQNQKYDIFAFILNMNKRALIKINNQKFINYINETQYFIRDNEGISLKFKITQQEELMVLADTLNSFKINLIHLEIDCSNLIDDSIFPICTILKNFPSLTYIFLYFKFNLLKTSGIDILSLSLESLFSVKKLYLCLNNNDITFTNLQTLCVGISHMPDLIELSLDLSSTQMKTKTSSLRQLFKMSKLKSLEIILASNSIDLNDFLFLPEEIINLNTLISLHLNMMYNIISKQSFHGFLTVLSSLTNLISLKLNFSCNGFNIGEIDDFYFFSSSLSRLKNLKNFYLDCSYNTILSVGIISISNSFRFLTELTSLTIILTGIDIHVEAGLTLAYSIRYLVKLKYLKMTLSGRLFNDIVGLAFYSSICYLKTYELENVMLNCKTWMIGKYLIESIVNKD